MDAATLQYMGERVDRARLLTQQIAKCRSGLAEADKWRDRHIVRLLLSGCYVAIDGIEDAKLSAAIGNLTEVYLRGKIEALEAELAAL